MKKIKQKLPAVFLILLAVLFIPGVAHAKEFQGSLWNFKKTIKETSGAFTYYAYPSKNQKEAWIYKINIKGWKDCSKLPIPSKLDNKKVTRLGSREVRQRDSDEVYNIFGIAMEPWHPYNNGEYTKTKRIQKLILPDTVKIIQPTAFGGMDSIRTVVIPDSVKTLAEYTFYHCDKLSEVELPAALKKLDIAAFRHCPKLTEIKLSSKNKKYQVKNNCVITKKKKELIFAPSCGQTLKIPEGVKILKNYAFSNCIAATVHIPASVEKIEKDAFYNPFTQGILRIDNVTVDDQNSVYGKDGQCIYHKIDKTLTIVIWDKKGDLYISDKVERMTGSSVAVGPGYLRVLGKSKVVYPKNLKTVASNGFFSADRAYFKGENPPDLIGMGWEKITCLPDYSHIYVPEGSVEVYRQWYKKYCELKQPDIFDTFKPEDKI